MRILPWRPSRLWAPLALIGICVVTRILPQNAELTRIASVLSHYALSTDDASQIVRVYYNLFVAEQVDKDRVSKLVAEQFALLQPHHRVYVHSIGHPLDLPNSTTLLQHQTTGNEMDTLHPLWKYCQQYPAAKVVYLHSKGSFHPTRENELMRPFLTVGALSQECHSLPAACNVCASRMSPIPHPHVPGNMWLARCDYIHQLVDPLLFEAAMENVSIIPRNTSTPHCHGLSRFAAEHWVLSHPQAMPCDLSRNRKYVWAYMHLPRHNFSKRLAMAPRFRPSTYRKHGCIRNGKHTGYSLSERLVEYRELYNETPPEHWWGWGFFRRPRPVRAAVVRRSRFSSTT